MNLFASESSRATPLSQELGPPVPPADRRSGFLRQEAEDGTERQGESETGARCLLFRDSVVGHLKDRLIGAKDPCCFFGPCFSE